MAQNGPKWSKTAQKDPTWPSYQTMSAKILLEWALPKMAKNSQKLQERPKVVPDSYRLWVLLGKNDPTCFLARPIWKKTTTLSILLLCKVNLLDSKTNKQTKHQDLSEKIHQYYIENTYFCFRRNANKKTLSDKNCFLSLCWACFSINYIFCDFKRF